MGGVSYRESLSGFFQNPHRQIYCTDEDGGSDTMAMDDLFLSSRGIV